MNFFTKFNSVLKSALAIGTRNFKIKYMKTKLGILWSLITPLLTVCTFSIVFIYGFKVPYQGGIPFDIYFLSGYLPWILFADSIVASSTSLVNNKYLINKIAFPLEALTLSEIFTCSMNHFILLLMTIVLLLIHNINLTFYILNILYGYSSLVVLLIGFGWILSSLNLFKRDLMHALPGILGILFWLTPIVWDERMIPEKYRFLLNINPMYHIVKVYRGALFEKSVFWFDIYSLLLFWFIALFSVICGFYIFNSLRDYFIEID